MAGPTGAMLLVCEPSEHLAPLVEEEARGGAAEDEDNDLGGPHGNHHEQTQHIQQRASLQPPPGLSSRSAQKIGMAAAPPVGQPSAGQVFLKRSASTRWNV
jgi:hypothetical protein